MRTDGNAEERRMSGFTPEAKPLDSVPFSQESPGQSYPQHYPQASDALGTPLTIRQVAEVLGCSPWTVRHKYLAKGLPHLRSGKLGKLIFYRNQVVQWILKNQRKGEM
jgi:hypothetical protein